MSEPRPWLESDVDRLARELHEQGESTIGATLHCQSCGRVWREDVPDSMRFAKAVTLLAKLKCPECNDTVKTMIVPVWSTENA